MIVTAHRPDELERINRMVHDCWFDCDAIIGPSLEVVEVPLEVSLPVRAADSASPTGIASRRALFRVRGVKSIRVEDSQGIGRYDINHLEFDAKNALLIVKTNIPMVWEMRVGEWVAELVVSS